MSKQKFNGKLKSEPWGNSKRFYHASPYHFKPGDFIVPNPPKKRNFRSSFDAVFMTNDPNPHSTVIGMAVLEGWVVYEVEPIGEVFIGFWDDYISSHPVRVVRVVGNARGIAKKKKVKKSHKADHQQYLKTLDEQIAKEKDPKEKRILRIRRTEAEYQGSIIFTRYNGFSRVIKKSRV